MVRLSASVQTGANLITALDPYFRLKYLETQGLSERARILLEHLYEEYQRREELEPEDPQPTNSAATASADAERTSEEEIIASMSQFHNPTAAPTAGLNQQSELERYFNGEGGDVKWGTSLAFWKVSISPTLVTYMQSHSLIRKCQERCQYSARLPVIISHLPQPVSTSSACSLKPATFAPNNVVPSYLKPSRC